MNQNKDLQELKKEIKISIMKLEMMIFTIIGAEEATIQEEGEITIKEAEMNTNKEVEVKEDQEEVTFIEALSASCNKTQMRC